VFELQGVGGWGSWTPNCFLNPPNTVKFCTWGELYYYTVYIRFTSQFSSVSNYRKVQPPANFSQFKHCSYHASNQWLRFWRGWKSSRPLRI